jgi:signal transduction histidine kinase
MRHRLPMRYDQSAIRWALAAAMLLLAFAGLMTYQTFRSHLRSSELTQHTIVVLDRVRHLLAELVDTETGERGFLLTGNDAYLQPLDTARPEIPRLLAELRALSADNPRQLSRLDAIEKRADEQFTLMARFVALRRAYGNVTAMPVGQLDSGKANMDEIRVFVASMEREEEDLFAARATAQARGERKAILFILLGYTSAIGLLLAAGIVTSREMRARVQSEAKLADSVRELIASNRELEQFAYVASHDLQEPLRMVANYCQLLKRRYHSRLDADADEFIGFAVDGARRMQVLIDDLLAYSRVGTRREKFTPVAMEAVLQDVLKNLEAAVTESAAAITNDPLPIVTADFSQLVQLLQNLIGNALKFRGEKSPSVHISAVPRGDDWLFGVRDHGIGIAPEYRGQIFLIFQRLHSKEEYPGTGIGLAISKKIVERHGGTIWVESTEGGGSTFYFTLPRNRSPFPPA